MSENENPVEQIITRARKLNANITCSNCDFERPFADYLENNPDLINEEAETMDLDCPNCGSPTTLRKRTTENRTPNAFVVSGLEELNELIDE